MGNDDNLNFAWKFAENHEIRYRLSITLRVPRK